MNANDELAPLLLALWTGGMKLAPHPSDSERLRHRPASIPPDLAERLRTHRTALLRLLVVGHTPADGTDAGYVYGERLGIADRGGYSRILLGGAGGSGGGRSKARDARTMGLRGHSQKARRKRSDA